MNTFATYLHPQTMLTSKPRDRIPFFGFGWPYFQQVRSELAAALGDYRSLPLQNAADNEFLRVHTPLYLQQLHLMATDTPPPQIPKLSLECTGMEYCLPGYCYSLGGMFNAIDQMRAGNLSRAYCFSFGGHHAYADWGHGYCILNPLAVATRYAQACGLSRVLIVDWDHHHGDGTQAIFAHDPSVYCISIHSAADLYMASACGLAWGTTTAAASVGHCNIPLLNVIYDDTFGEQMQLSGQFYRAHESQSRFQEALQHLPWQPSLICIFAGYDAHRDDCGKGISNWTNEDFCQLTRVVLDLAHANACPVLSIHGGGYNLPVTIAAAAGHVAELANYRPRAVLIPNG
jgi:acetoin utilization deacetylase AcuC-like enzyme